MDKEKKSAGTHKKMIEKRRLTDEWNIFLLASPATISLFFSLMVSGTGLNVKSLFMFFSDWYALREVLHKFLDTIQLWKDLVRTSRQTLNSNEKLEDSTVGQFQMNLNTSNSQVHIFSQHHYWN
jgi:hypothetical protein